MNKRKKRSQGKVGRSGIEMRDLPDLRQARALWQKNDRLQALALFQRTAKRHPTNLLAIADASRALGSFYRIRDAEQLLESVVPVIQRTSNGQQRAQQLYLIAQSFRIIRRPLKALALFREAFESDSGQQDAALELALLLERQGALDEAKETLTRSNRRGASAESQMLLGRIDRRLRDFDSAQRSLSDVARAPKAFWMTRARAWSELAKLNDDCQDYDKAWDAVIESQKLGRKHRRAASDHRDRIVPKLTKIIEQLDASTLSAWTSRETACRAPHVLLSGLPRSGTTLVAQQLHQYPQVTACDELDVFPGYVLPALLGRQGIDALDVDLIGQVTDERLDELAAHYLRSIRETVDVADESRHLIDKNPSLLMLFPIYLRVLASTKLLVVVRDPRDVITSTMLTHFPLNDYSVDFLDLETGAARLALETRQFLRLKELLGDICKVVSYERWIERPKELRDSVAAWLGLDSESNSAKEPDPMWVNSPSYESSTAEIQSTSVGRWRNYEVPLGPALQSLNETRDLLSALS